MTTEIVPVPRCANASVDVNASAAVRMAARKKKWVGLVCCLKARRRFAVPGLVLFE